MSTVISPAATRTYTADLAHSEAAFQVRHLITKVRGRFSDFAATIEYDEADPTRSSVSLTIQAASIDTNQAERDAHLRSADFFAVDEFPTLTFVSTGITRKSDDAFDVAGKLTIRGNTRDIVLPVTALGKAKDPWGNERLAFETEITLNRKDYGLTWNAALETGGFLVGDEVKVSVSLQAM
ncbi:MAG: YceI family protein [Vicinamibacterales bacterium]